MINELLGKTVCPASQTPSLHRPVKLQYGSIPFVRLLNKASKEVSWLDFSILKLGGRG